MSLMKDTITDYKSAVEKPSRKGLPASQRHIRTARAISLSGGYDMLEKERRPVTCKQECIGEVAYDKDW